MINKPHIITIKLFTTGNLPTNAELEAMLSQQCFNFSLLSVELAPMRFDGIGLVPVRAPTPTVETKPKAAPPAPKKPSSPAPKPRAVNFVSGSDADRIWQLIRNNDGITSTELREQLELGSGPVNTTIYRLRKADMIRSSGIGKYGDKYVSREWDTKPTDNDNDDNNTNTEE
jgi:hypothetical protein